MEVGERRRRARRTGRCTVRLLVQQAAVEHRLARRPGSDDVRPRRGGVEAAADLPRRSPGRRARQATTSSAYGQDPAARGRRKRKHEEGRPLSSGPQGRRRTRPSAAEGNARSGLTPARPSCPLQAMVVHLLDGTYELFRHFYGRRRGGPRTRHPLRRGGRRPAHGARAGRDRGRPTSASPPITSSSRSATTCGPATRPASGIEPALKAQFHPLEEALAAMGVAVWPMVELEADDALASAARIAAADARVEKVCIWTPDKDLAQCVVGDRVVQVDRRAKAIRDADGVQGEVRRRAGAHPRLPGPRRRRADGYPGIPGIGKVGAARLREPLRADRGVPAETCWASKRELALLFKDLATLRNDAALFGDVDELRWQGPPDGFAAEAERLGDERLAERARKPLVSASGWRRSGCRVTTPAAAAGRAAPRAGRDRAVQGTLARRCP